MGNKVSDLAGPGIGNYEDVAKALPDNYESKLSPKETQEAINFIKESIEAGLGEALNLIRVTVPLIVDEASGVNDMLDRDGSRTPVSFHISNDNGKNPINAQVVQAATKWKRMALKQFDMHVGEGLYTDMHAVRKDYFLDHDHSAYVDQWDWEMVITDAHKNLNFLKEVVRLLWRTIKTAEVEVQKKFPALLRPDEANLPEELHFIHAEEILDMYPDLPRKERETKILEKYPAVFIIGIGWKLDDGYPHELRAPDYDDWVTPTEGPDGRVFHGLNGDILVYNPTTGRRHELTSMGVRVDKHTLRQQLEITGQTEMLELPYHQAILNDEVPLSIGGGIGQSRVYMHLLQKAHIGEVSVTVWPEKFKEICRSKNIHVLE
ncbi:MAG: aspartate--ammonia ligase [Bacteroidetes bacterium]|nr:aspartate--ammonia ligase [Bacteroidota bacterium]